MAWVGPALGAAASVAGSLISANRGSEMAPGWDERLYRQEQANLVNLNETARQNAENLAFAREQMAMQREFAQMGIRWRVYDAQEAGLHPLFALSGGGATYSPTSAVMAGAPDARITEEVPTRKGSFGSMGQDISRALMAAFSQEEVDRRALEQRRLLAQTEMSELQVQAMRAQVAKQEQELYWSTPIEMMPRNAEGVAAKAVRTDRLPEGRALFEATPEFGSAVGSQRFAPHIDTASLNDPVKFWQQHVMARDGFRMLLPKTSEPQEVFEDKPLWFWAAVVKGNMDEYGFGWLRRASEMFPSGTTLGKVIVMGLEGGAKAIQEAMRSGGREILNRIGR